MALPVALSSAATRCELFTDKRSPIALVRIKNGSKRRQRPIVLTVEQFELVVATLREPTANGKRVLVYDTRNVAAGKLGEIGWHTFRYTYPLVAGRDRRSDEDTAGTDAACLHPNDDEHLWAGHVVIEAGSEWEGC